MDPRLQLPLALGSAAEGAFILRNAGGRVTDDVIRGLVVATRVLDVTEVGVIHHTDCRMQRYTNDEFALMTGVARDYKAFKKQGLEKSILEDVQELRDCGELKAGLRIWGGVYSVDDHTISVVADTDD
jgi:carbonic anhydrase